MTRADRLTRDVTAFLFKTGYGGQAPHTFWATGLKFKLSPNQLWLNNRKIVKRIQERAQQTDHPTIAQELGVDVTVIERVLSDARSGSDS